MRVAAVQFEVDTASRTATLQRALSALDTAAELDPCPDLVVLPAFLDTCQDQTGPHHEIARGPGSAACGFRARNWGVFVAMGLAERAKPLPTLKGVLLDRDGDYRLIQPMTRASESLAKCFQCENAPLGVADLLIGRIAVLTDGDIISEDAWKEVVGRGAQLIVGTIGGGAVKATQLEAALTKLARQFGRPCVVADVVARGQNPRLGREGVSRIINDEGRVMAAAQAGSNETIMAELELPAMSSSEDTTVSEVEG